MFQQRFDFRRDEFLVLRCSKNSTITHCHYQYCCLETYHDEPIDLRFKLFQKEGYFLEVSANDTRQYTIGIMLSCHRQIINTLIFDYVSPSSDLKSI